MAASTAYPPSSINESTLVPNLAQPPTEYTINDSKTIVTSSASSSGPKSSVHLSTLIPTKDESMEEPTWRSNKNSIAHKIAAAHQSGIGMSHVTHGQGPSPWSRHAATWEQPKDYAGLSSHQAAKDQVRGGPTWSFAGPEMPPRHFFGQVCWPSQKGGGLTPFHGITMSKEGRRHYDGHFGGGHTDAAETEAEAAATTTTATQTIDVSDAAVDPPEATSLPWRGDLTPRGRPERAHVPEPKPQSPSTPGGRKQLPKTHSFLEGGEARAALYGR